MPILDELKKKANGKADSANNIAEAIAQMDFSEGSVTPEEELAGSRIKWIDFEYDSDNDRYFCHDFYAMGLFNDLTLNEGTAFYAARFDGRIYTVTSVEHHHDDTINKEVYRITFNSVYHSTDDESGNPVVVSDEFYTSTVYDDETYDMEGQTITREVLTIAPVTE